MSELKDIYKFLFDYFKIYKETFGQSVSKWKVADLNNAVKWSNGIEEFYAKIRHRKNSAKFIQDIKLILKHWKIDETKCEDMLQNATKYLKKSLISNKYLCDEVKNNLLEAYQNQQIEKVNESKQKSDSNDQGEGLLSREVDKICLKLYLFKNNFHLIDLLFDYTINNQNNLEFMVKIFEKLKDFSYDTYKVCFMRLLNKKYYKLYMNDPTNGLFNLETNELIQAYYCYLIFVFTGIVDEFKLEIKDINDPKNFKTEFYDLELIVSHFEHVIKISKNVKFIKIIQTKAKIDSDWNFLLNQLKLRYVKETQQIGNIINDLVLDDSF